jgi:hypothetical protein
VIHGPAANIAAEAVLGYKARQENALLSPDFPAILGLDPAHGARCERQFAVRFQSKPTRARAPIVLSATLAGMAAVLSGCMSSPTYGTGVSSNQQLLNDVSGLLTLGPRDKGPEIAYTPRAELVKPSSLAVLPEPQQDMASTDNPAWPESPEQRRARLRAEATANQDNPAYRSPITGSPGTVVADARAAGVPSTFDDPERSMNSPAMSLHQSQRIELKRRVQENNQGDPASRKYLSEPPTDYRQPSAAAPTGDLGVDEWKKERMARRASGDGKTWRDFVPWL